MSNDKKDVQISKDSNSQKIDPSAMTVAQAAKVLSAVGNGQITEEIIQRHIAAGAPASDGRINLVHYAAWLSREISLKNGD